MAHIRCFRSRVSPKEWRCDIEVYWNIYQTAILLDVISKVCVGVLSARLILLISKLVKAAYEERNVWETVEEETDKDQ